MSSSPPRVSVIIPAFNQERFVAQAVDSALGQAFAEKEIIVVNDGSTDDTARILAGYRERIRVVDQANAGVAAARNTGVRQARGRMIAFLDADDLWFPEMLHATVAALDRCPTADLVIGGWDCVSAVGESAAPLLKPASTFPHANVRQDFLRTIVLGNMFPVHAFLFRRECFDCCGLFDHGLSALEDWDLLLRLAAHGHGVELIDTPIARYRRHGSSMSHDLIRMERAYDQTLAKLFADPGVAARLADLRVHAEIGRQLLMATYYLDGGGAAEARRCVTRATALHRTAPADAELSRRYLSMARERFPDDAATRRFVRTLQDAIPAQRSAR